MTYREFLPMADPIQPDVTTLTVQLLSAYLSNNTVAHAEIADLIRSTKVALTDQQGPGESVAETQTYTPAVSVRKSLSSPDHILSLIDGKAYKTLRRHLTANGLTPESYRERYGLPGSYPMVAPSFAEQRRAIAEKIGLGRRPKAAPAKADASASVVPAAAPAPDKAPAPAPAAASATESAPVVAAPAPKASARKASVAKSPAVKAPAAKAQPAAEAKAADSAPKRGKRSTLKLFATPDDAGKTASTPAAKAPATPKTAKAPKTARTAKTRGAASTATDA